VSKEHPYTELGRRIQAALISYQLGLVGVDSTLKKLPPGQCGPGFAELGETLLKATLGAFGKDYDTQGGGRVQ
jgi:hypothetical protein